jgi:hypothetical protein
LTGENPEQWLRCDRDESQTRAPAKCDKREGGEDQRYARPPLTFSKYNFGKQDSCYSAGAPEDRSSERCDRTVLTRDPRRKEMLDQKDVSAQENGQGEGTGQDDGQVLEGRLVPWPPGFERQLSANQRMNYEISEDHRQRNPKHYTDRPKQHPEGNGAEQFQPSLSRRSGRECCETLLAL